MKVIGPAASSPVSGRGHLSGQEALPPSRQHVNLRQATFPLAPLKVTCRSVSRGRRLREGDRRRAAVVEATNGVLEALNFLSGVEGGSDARIHPVSLAEAPPVVQQIHGAVSSVDFEQVGEEASLKAVLRGRGGDYESSDSTQGALASFSVHALALPESTAQAPLVYDLLEGDEQAQQNVKEPERLLRNADEVAALIKEHGDIQTYVDPVLRSSRRHYVSFCRKMFRAGLCRPTFVCKETVGIFSCGRREGHRCASYLTRGGATAASGRHHPCLSSPPRASPTSPSMVTVARSRRVHSGLGLLWPSPTCRTPSIT